MSVSFSCQMERQDRRLVPVIMAGTEVNSESIAFHSVSCLVYLQLPGRLLVFFYFPSVILWIRITVQYKSAKIAKDVW